MLQAAQDIDTAADTLGASAEQIQALELFARGRGANIRDLVDAIVQLQTAAAEASTDNDDLLETFRRLGVEGQLPEDGVELFFRLAEGVNQSRRSVQQLTADISRLLGEEATRQFFGAFRERGGTLRAEIEQTASSDLVQTQDEINKQAELNRQTQRELAVAMNRLATIMSQQLPRLVDALERSIEFAEDVNDVRQQVAENIGRTAVGENEPFNLLANAALRSPLGLQGRLATEFIAQLSKIEVNTRESGTLR